MGIWVAKRKCGCRIAAAFENYDHQELAQDIGEWVLRGDTVEYLDQDTIQIVKCPEHKGQGSNHV